MEYIIFQQYFRHIYILFAITVQQVLDRDHLPFKSPNTKFSQYFLLTQDKFPSFHRQGAGTGIINYSVTRLFKYYIGERLQWIANSTELIK